jgi:prepilin-type N-terminal cleavage/methylation domain-containing protein/prepilin-type processing-associated H-X9-DG protein
MAQKARGFTLIELLVVVAIIALLISILLPSLARARDQSRTVLCATNMRQIGQAIHMFSDEHDTRAPGGASVTGSSVPWQQILNIEFFNTGSRFNSSYAIGSTSQKTLSCPNYVPYLDPSGQPYSYRPYCIDPDVLGNSPTNADGSPATNFYGQIVDPKSIDPSYLFYQYGAKITRFGPYEFLLVESFYGNDALGLSGPFTSTGSVLLTGSPPVIPNYCNVTGELSFRHPYSKKANFLYFDAHVEPLTPKDDVYSLRRYLIDH